MSRTPPTWKADKIALARIFAEHFGWTRTGNWISIPMPSGPRAVACGWEHLADRLIKHGFITVGVGINWRKAGETPRLPKVERDSAGHWMT